MTYTYKCINCNHVVEVRRWGILNQGPLPATKTCPVCQQVMIREFHSVPIIFKGTGWGGDK